MPEGFRLPSNYGFWTALSTSRSLYGPGEEPKIIVFGRLAPGIGMAAAQAELTAIGERTSAEFPLVYEHLRPEIVPYTLALLDLHQYPAWRDCLRAHEQVPENTPATKVGASSRPPRPSSSSSRALLPWFQRSGRRASRRVRR